MPRALHALENQPPAGRRAPVDLDPAALPTPPAPPRPAAPTRPKGLHIDVRRARVSLVLVFMLLGGLTATWAARIPAIKGALHLSTGSLGLALLGPAVGLVASTAPTGAVLARSRPRPVMAVGMLIFASSLPLAALATGTGSLFVVLLAWGVGGGMLDVSMNTEAAALQDRAARPIMSSLHASYSVGALIGAGLGALVAAAGVSVGWHLLVAGAVTGVIGLGAIASLPTSGAPAHPSAVGGARHLPVLSRGLLALAAVAFGCFLAEGATIDWSAVYLHGSLGASVGFAALGYTVFAVAMIVGRLAGDHLGQAYGPVRLVRVSTLVAAVGFALALAAGRPVVALVGFGVLGLGLSVVVPQVFSAAAVLGSSGPSLALVTGFGYVGMMAGPPLIGGLAEAVGLPTALTVIVAVALLTAVLAGSLNPSRPPAPARA